ncbi:MAG: hypothetical protein VX642_12430 [Bdellovibrionota bacterium]|nr:hypothetical protein [Bdellovibrionota bacterium]
MKKYLLILMSLSCLSMACPNLTGSYLCEVEDDNGNLVKSKSEISQSIVDGYTVYTVVEEGQEPSQLVADGKTIVDGAMEAKVTCEAEKLVMEFSGSENGLDLLMLVKTYLMGSELVNDYTIEVSQGGELISDESMSYTCQKL